MYSGDGRLCVCLSVCPSPHSHTTARTRMYNLGECLYLCAIGGICNRCTGFFLCYDNVHICKPCALQMRIAPNEKCQRVLVLAIGLVSIYGHFPWTLLPWTFLPNTLTICQASSSTATVLRHITLYYLCLPP